MRYPTKIPTTWAAGVVLAAALASAAAAASAMLSQSDRSLFAAAQAPLHSDPSVTRVAQAQTPADPTTPGRTFRDCSECPEMVEVPAGKFIMGSDSGDIDEKPAHEVVIAKPFAVGKYEVTFDEYAACVAGGGCTKRKNPNDFDWGRGRRPVVDVTWDSAREYAEWLSQKTGKPYRLLTEAEWEYAARAGTTTKYAFGDTITHDQANFASGNPTGKAGEGQTMEVGSYPPNAWGLYDMHGNVWEWVEDCYDINYEKVPADGTARIFPGCPTRALRGGSWDYPADEIHSSVRFALKPAYRLDEIGFRVARSLE